MSPYPSQLLLVAHCFVHFFYIILFFFFVRVHKVRKETLDWVDPLDLRYVYQVSVQTSLNTTLTPRWSSLLGMYSAF